MSQTNLVKITTGYIHIDEPLHLDEDVTLIIQGKVLREIKTIDEFSDEHKTIAEVKGVIAEVQNKDGKVISEQTEI